MRKKTKRPAFCDLSVVMDTFKSETLKSKNRYFTMKLIFSTFKINADLEAI